MPFVLVQTLNLFCAGLLAGIEVAVRFGVRGPVATLAASPQIQVRQGLIRTLRVLTPIVFGLTLLSALVVTGLGRAVPGGAMRWFGLAAILAWTVVTFLGTVPINKALLTWRPEAPPENWKEQVKRWERLDTFRAAAAVIAFAGFLAAAAQRI